MAFPIRTYVELFDETYGECKNRGEFGHLVIRDSNTAGKDYLLVGLNNNEGNGLDVSIRLTEEQAWKIMYGIHRWLRRIHNATTTVPKEGK